MQAVIFCGIQATGKSSFFREQFFDTHVRINLDMLRTRHREALLLTACLDGKTKFVVDNTNPIAEDRQRYIIPAKAAQFEVIGYYFRSRIEDALHHNRQREVAYQVPDVAMYATHKKLQIPTYDEGFDRLYYVQIENGHFEILEWNHAL